MTYRIICLFLIAIFLIACPYKEVYKPIAKKEFFLNGLKIRLNTLFYNSWKGVSTCDVGFTITNQTMTILKLNFSESYLINSKDTLWPQKIKALGRHIIVDNVFEVLPQQDSSISLSFSDFKQYFGDTIKFNLNVSNTGNYMFIYKKIR